LRSRQKVEFGDFQTPPNLARWVADLACARGMAPKSVVEPTCGQGEMLLAALDRFPAVASVVGLDVNREHVTNCRARLEARGWAGDARVDCESFFGIDWAELLGALPAPVLVIGNPPWVTNSELSARGSANLPGKSNARADRGIDAITGKSNFDISEWMLDRLAEALCERDATLAMLCKTSVARRVLAGAWRAERGPESADLYPIDSAEHFGASVDACLLLCRFRPGKRGCECRAHARAAAAKSVATAFGLRGGELVADVARYERWQHLLGSGGPRWRSGVKHDCARVMELGRDARGFRNGLGESFELEPDYVFPMLKSSDLANGADVSCYMLVTQRSTGEATEHIGEEAPKTWRYLLDHAELFDRRASTIYARRPRFSVFGVGPYTFTPWKVAISGFYKRFEFSVVGPVGGKPVVFDDTCYFLPCESEREARHLAARLDSEGVRGLLESLVFWDAKRPITARLLQRVDLSLARAAS